MRVSVCVVVYEEYGAAVPDVSASVPLAVLGVVRQNTCLSSSGLPDCRMASTGLRFSINRMVSIEGRTAVFYLVSFYLLLHLIYLV